MWPVARGAWASTVAHRCMTATGQLAGAPVAGSSSTGWEPITSRSGSGRTSRWRSPAMVVHGSPATAKCRISASADRNGHAGDAAAPTAVVSPIGARLAGVEPGRELCQRIGWVEVTVRFVVVVLGAREEGS